MGQTRWYKKPNSRIPAGAKALDPSMGTGGDYSAIQVFEPSVTHKLQNGDTTKQQYPDKYVCLQIFVSILKITQCTQSIYWSVENNGLGEAALIVNSRLW